MLKSLAGSGVIMGLEGLMSGGRGGRALGEVEALPSDLRLLGSIGSLVAKKIAVSRSAGMKSSNGSLSRNVRILSGSRHDLDVVPSDHGSAPGLVHVA